jgi:transposase
VRRSLFAEQALNDYPGSPAASSSIPLSGMGSCLCSTALKLVYERLPELTEPCARRTNRRRDGFVTSGWALGGEAGAKQCVAHATAVCASTLRSLLRRQGVTAAPTPRVLGVDDWSFRAHQAGTLLVDLEQHRAVAVLLGSDEKGFAQWLADQPGVEVISRDRGASYLKGATRGAPQAKQVLDRWHVLKHLGEGIQKPVTQHIDVLRQAGKPGEKAHPAD